jgi:hypothetical protein
MIMGRVSILALAFILIPPQQEKPIKKVMTYSHKKNRVLKIKI